MADSVNAEIIAIGTEILLGEITDTNSVYLAQKLRGLGVNLYFMTSVGDNERRIAEAIQIALERADVVITCGGLGPTIDDMTRQSVALATERGLTFHQHLLDQIAARFAGFHVKMTENNRRQAYLPDDAVIVENPVGTAPSFIVPHRDKYVISLPGVPREMKYLFENAVVPFLRQRYGLGIIKARVLRTAGIGESMLDEAIGVALLEGSNPTIGLAAHAGQVDIRITAKADSEEAADRMIAGVEAEVRQRVGPYIYGVDSATLEGILAAALLEKGMRLAILEAGLPPTVSARMKRQNDGALVVMAEQLGDPSAAAAFVQAMGQKRQTGQGHGALRSLAEAAAQGMAATGPNVLGIALIADPTRVEDHADADEGSAFAVAINGSVRSRSYGFGGASEDALRFSSTWALASAWQMLTQL